MRWKTLGLLSLAELLAMSVWFTGTAVSGELQGAWGLSVGQVGWLTTGVQLGFVAGTAFVALLNLADILPSRFLFSGSALLAALANFGLLAAPGFFWALLARFFTGFFLAGVYPPAMKMIATWFKEARGLAIGTVVGALTVGKAAPYILRAVPDLSLSGVVSGATLAGLTGAFLVLVFYSDGPHPFRRAPFSWSLAAKVLRHRETRLAVLGYLGHMWELYAMWTWVPAFLLASASTAALSGGTPVASVWVDVAAFGAIAAGGLGCVWGGWAADIFGREKFVNLAMAVSGLLSLTIGLFFGGSFWVLAGLTWLWGFFVVADSAQFSAMVTEVAPQEAVGTALTLQTSLGFLLTLITIQGVPVINASFGWAWTFPILAVGPAFGIAAMARLLRVRRATPPSVHPHAG
jgi:MFS family permease